MIRNILDEIYAYIAALVGPALDWLYLAEWWVIFAIVLGISLVIGYFFNFQWVRAILGVFVLVVGAFVAGGTEMYRHIKAQKKHK